MTHFTNVSDMHVLLWYSLVKLLFSFIYLFTCFYDYIFYFIFVNNMQFVDSIVTILIQTTKLLCHCHINSIYLWTIRRINFRLSIRQLNRDGDVFFANVVFANFWWSQVVRLNHRRVNKTVFQLPENRCLAQTYFLVCNFGA